jgi:hypothetical protein
MICELKNRQQILKGKACRFISKNRSAVFAMD